MSEEEAAKLAKKMIDAEFDFNDFLKQAQMMKGMGSLGGVANMIPGMAGKITPQQLNQAEVRRSPPPSCCRTLSSRDPLQIFFHVRLEAKH